MTAPRNSVTLRGVLVLLVALVLAAGCAQKTPEQKLIELRSYYTAELNSIVTRAQEVPLPEPMAEEEEAAADETDESSAEDEMGIEEEELPVGPLLSTVLLDVVVRHEAKENLPGVTLDVTHADPEGNEKAHYRFWVDTSNLVRGQHIQITHQLEDVDYVEGDGFFVEVRNPVPEAERSEYREFDLDS